MKILAYFGHPSQYLFLKNSIRILREHHHEVHIVIKSKDVLEQLLKNDQESYLNILSEGRKDNKASILIGLVKRDLRLSRIVRKIKPDLLIGSDPSLSHVGFLFRIPCITCLEDDVDVIPYLAKLTYPFTKHILVPVSCNTGKWSYKKIGYQGFMKLAYLHPRYFKPDYQKVKKYSSGDYFLIRLPKLTAHHDFGIKGIDSSLLKQIIQRLSVKGDVLISAERTLEPELEKHRLNINPSDIHHFLYYSQLLISDSQSMSGEAAMLGTPSVRFSDFTGRIGVLEELEHTYELTFGVKTEDAPLLLKKLETLLTIPDLKEEFKKRRDKMLSEKIDVTGFMVWFVENYPESFRIMREDPGYQYRFK